MCYKALRVGSCRLLVNASCWKMWQVAEGTESDFLLDTVEGDGSSPSGAYRFNELQAIDRYLQG